MNRSIAALVLVAAASCVEKGPRQPMSVQGEGAKRNQGMTRVVIEKEGDTVVYRAETDPPIEGRGRTPRESLNDLKDKIRAAITDGALDGKAWEPFLSRDQLEKF
ncbi:MAG: hypothetical protein ACYTFI_09935, partial [Planctomycetota bacterium]